jgi:hypothetical protein
MEQIPTAEELFDKMLSENEETTSTEMMIEFAKLHVEAALKAAKEVDKKNRELKPKLNQRFSILNSYPLENIK